MSGIDFRETFSALLKEHGLATLLVVVGILIFVGFIPSPITAVKSTLDVHEARAGAEHIAIMKVHDEMLPVLRQICRNTAKTDHAQETCDKL
jgi:hypothetical protein